MFDVRVEHYTEGTRAFGQLKRQLEMLSTVPGQPPRVYAIGERFKPLAPIRGADLPAIGRALVADKAQAPLGVFAFFTFSLDRRVARTVAPLDPALVEARLVRAAEEALKHRMTGIEGLSHIAYDRQGAPEVLILISPSRSDGRPAKILGPVDIQGLEAAWHARTHEAFGLRRELEEASPSRALDERWRSALGAVSRAVRARMSGEISQEELRGVIDRAAEVQKEWDAGRLGRDPGLRDLEVVNVRIERGASHLSPLDGREQREVLSLAVEKVIKDRVPQEVSLVHVQPPGSRDLKALVAYEPREDRQVDRRALKEALQEELGPAITEEAGRYCHWSPSEELGRLVVPDRPAQGAPRDFEAKLRIVNGQTLLEQLGPTPRGAQTRDAVLLERLRGPLHDALQKSFRALPDRLTLVPPSHCVLSPGGAVDVLIRLRRSQPQGFDRHPLESARTALERELPLGLRRALATQYGRPIRPEALRVSVGPLVPLGEGSPFPSPGRPVQPKARRLAPGGDIHTIRFRVEGGVEAIRGLRVRTQQEILGGAASAAFPGLRESGWRPDVAPEKDGRALLVRVTVPSVYLGDRDLLPSPSAQARFSNEVHRLSGQAHGKVPPLGRAVLGGQERPPTPPPAVQRRAALGRLGQMIPAALRTGRTMLRWASRLLPQED